MTGPNDGLFFVWDESGERQFLIDTGGEVMPATGLDTCTGQLDPPLRAANDSTIKTYGVCTIPLCMTSMCFTWKFTVTEVSRPFLGANSLHANSFLINLRGKCLVDAETYHSVV